LGQTLKRQFEGSVEPPPGQTGWPDTPYEVVWSPQHFFFFFGIFFIKKIKYVMGAFWEKKKGGQNGRIATI
jgi:hypothetical protein